MSEETPSVSADGTNDEDEESVIDEDTVTADVPSPSHEDLPPLERPNQLHSNSDVVEALIS